MTQLDAQLKSLTQLKYRCLCKWNLIHLHPSTQKIQGSLPSPLVVGRINNFVFLGLALLFCSLARGESCALARWLFHRPSHTVSLSDFMEISFKDSSDWIRPSQLISPLMIFFFFTFDEFNPGSESHHSHGLWPHSNRDYLKCAEMKFLKLKSSGTLEAMDFSAILECCL